MTAAARPLMPGCEAPLREKLAQLLFVRIGSNLPPVRTVEEDEERVAQLLEQAPVGGLCLFNGSYANTPGTLARLQKCSRYPLLISTDMERGAGQQLRGYPPFPHAMAFDALGAGAAEAVRSFARLTAETARAAGVHLDFAPTADVNSDPRNPIISTRAFGTRRERVAELASAFVRGCTDGGLLTAAKHFPGHGDTHEDSHHARPVVTASREVLLGRELPPFRAAIEAGVPLVMSAHVCYPALDETGQPATFSRKILVELLRQELGFAGAIVTDSLLMAGAKIGFADEGEMAVKALNAGVDILLDPAEPVATLDALEAAVHAGQLSPTRIDEALSRVGRLKELVFHDERSSPFDEAANRLQTEELASDVARRATIVSRNENELLPFHADQSLCAVLINPFPLPSNAEPPPLGAYLGQRFNAIRYFEVGADPADELLREIERVAGESQQRLAAIVVKPAAWHQFGLPPRLRNWLQALAERIPTAVACLGAPQGLEPYAAAAAQLCTFSDVPVSQRALADRLLSEA
jgi:beta-glucosidase-like glycosyl hydrolase